MTRLKLALAAAMLTVCGPAFSWTQGVLIECHPQSIYLKCQYSHDTDDYVDTRFFRGHCVTYGSNPCPSCLPYVEHVMGNPWIPHNYDTSNHTWPTGGQMYVSTGCNPGAWHWQAITDAWDWSIPQKQYDFASTDGSFSKDYGPVPPQGTCPPPP